MALPATYTEGFHNVEDVCRMRYVNLGGTRMKVSALGFGAACFGNHYGDFDPNEAKEVIRHALKLGVNYIDTAPYYGDGKSEKTIGEAIRGLPRSSYYIATKVGRYGTGFDFTYGSVLSSVDQSLERLGLDYVDVIQVHDIEFADSVDLIVNQTIPALYEVVRCGKAKFIGVTGYPVSLLKEMVQVSPVTIDCILSYSRLTLMDDTLNEFLPFFKSKGLGIIHASPSAMGLLTNAGAEDWHPGKGALGELCSKAGAFCKENGVELGNLAVEHTICQPDVDVHVIGMGTRELVDRNVNIILNGITEKEKIIREELFKRFFRPSDRKNWENVELDNYRKQIADKS